MRNCVKCVKCVIALNYYYYYLLINLFIYFLNNSYINNDKMATVHGRIKESHMKESYKKVSEKTTGGIAWWSRSKWY